jgi:proteasome lid subunit RPN8/RPN11
MLYLSKKEAEKIIEHSKRESPNEACGILAGKPTNEKGKNKAAEKVYEMTNTDKSTKTFFMDPKEQLKVTKEIRNEGFEMVGIYHSHPHTKAYPSAHDVKLAFYPEVSYVIVSLRDNKPILKVFRIFDGNITEEEVKIV